MICIAAALSLFVLACDDDTTPTPTPSATVQTSLPTASPSATATVVTTPTPTSQTQNVCKPNPDPAPSSILVIDAPLPNASVQSPITVSGQVQAFEATFEMTLFNANGTPITTKTGMSQEGQVLSPFSQQITFPPSAAGPACLWVWQASARDGSVTKVGQVPLTLVP